MKKIIIINGPNINLVGNREPKSYGNINLNKYLLFLKKKYLKKKILIKVYYVDSQSKIIKKLQKIVYLKKKILGIIINAGAYTHTSLAISDTIKYVKEQKINVVEVHISNIFYRERFRHISLLSPNVSGIIIGFGVIVYELAIFSLVKKKVFI